MSSVSRRKAADTLTAIYGNRTFAISTVTSMLKANILLGDTAGGVSQSAPPVNNALCLRDFIARTRAENYSTYPDPTGGLLRVSVLHKRPDATVSPDPRMSRDDMGIDLDDLGVNDGEFLMGFEGVWQVSDENADLAVKQGSHLLPSLRGYVHPSMVRKIVGWERVPPSMVRKRVGWEDVTGLVWFHTASPDPAVLNWVGTGVVLPADSRPGVWGWAVRPKPLQSSATSPTK